MRALLLGLAAPVAAFALSAAPAQAQSSAGWSTRSGADAAHLSRSGDHRRWRDGHDRRDRRRYPGFGVAYVGGGWDGYNDRPRSWEPDSFNDWWHDRPDRAYPRWMRNNQNCERMWWSGGGWRC